MDSLDGGTADLEVSVLGDIVEQVSQLFEFSACMREEGIHIGNPTVAADGNPSLETPICMITDHGALMASDDVCEEFFGVRSPLR